MINNPESPTITDIECDSFMSGIESCAEWLTRMEPFLTIRDSEKVDDSLSGKAIVMTGFRSESLKEAILSRGGVVSDSVSSKTHLVIAKDLSSSSSKIANAKRWGVSVMEMNEALNYLNIQL